MRTEYSQAAGQAVKEYKAAAAAKEVETIIIDELPIEVGASVVVGSAFTCPTCERLIEVSLDSPQVCCGMKWQMECIAKVSGTPEA